MKTKRNLFALLAVVCITLFSAYSFKPDRPVKHNHNGHLTVATADCPCSTCNSTGACGYCSGRGQYNCAVCNGTGLRGYDSDGNQMNCSGCNGSGKITCSACGGGGKCGTCQGSGRLPCH